MFVPVDMKDTLCCFVMDLINDRVSGFVFINVQLFHPFIVTDMFYNLTFMFLCDVL